MEGIEDCFVKFFLQQAQEIEPVTIQTLIDHGYRTKLSLTAMDLERDLPLIDEIALAQRSLLRRYLTALQESQPFQVTLTKDPPPGTLSYDYQMGIPIKKRKYDVYIADQSYSHFRDDDRNSPENFESSFESAASSKKVHDSIVKKISKQKSQVIQKANPEMEQSKQNGTSTSKAEWRSPNANETRTRIVRDFDKMFTSINNGRDSQDQTLSQIPTNLMETSIVQDEEMSQINEEQNNSIRSKRGRKSIVPRTPSQLRYEKMRQSLADNSNTSNAGISSGPVSKTTRRSLFLSQSKSDSKDASTGENKKTVMTPAEREVLARIEAKKQSQTGTKSCRRKK
ncbi:uncharacterized protein LOC113796196 [Dermatophagoides pteronyssinus]|uniref:uncharacterized protein LOC113796196 n=1 Tax=Dermatophagoides pteronyssinus TaxID=6956 RepID=UPI003F675515